MRLCLQSARNVHRRTNQVTVSPHCSVTGAAGAEKIMKYDILMILFQAL